MAVSIARLAASDRQDWRRLYDAYAAFYEMPMEDATAAATWAWLQDPRHELEGAIARDGDGRAIGLAHYRRMPSPLRGTDIGFLDDLFVDPELRGQGVGAALIAHVEAVGRESGWAKIRWITAEDNGRARALYDRVATRTRWVTYELAQKGGPR